MKKFLTAVALAAVLVPAVFARQHAADSFGRHAGARGVFAQLNLTDEQKAQIKAIHEADRQANQALFTSFKAKVAEYRQLKQAGDPQAAATKAELQTMKAQVKAARDTTQQKVLAVLTPDQQAQFQQLRALSVRSFAAGRRSVIGQQLNLTADQKTQIKAIRQASKQQNQALFTAFRSTARQYRQLRQANDSKAADVKTQLDAMKPQVKAARMAARDQILTVLTPEQRAQLQQLRGKH